MAETLLHKWFEEVWNRRNGDAVHAMLAPDCVIHNLAADGQDVAGPAGFLAFQQSFLDAFPDTEITVHETVEQDDLIAGRWTMRASHAGHGLGFAPTHRGVTIPGMGIARVKDGRIVEGWNIWDAAAIRDQLGFVSTPPEIRP